MALNQLPVVLFLACSVLAAQPELPNITVRGTARIEVAPDLMTWRIDVGSKNTKLEALAEAHDKTVQRVLGFLRESGIPAEEVQTSRMSFGEDWEYVSGRREMRGYFASTRVRARSSDLDLYRTLWMGLAGIPGVSVEGVEFDTSKRIELQNQTRRMALLAAREKAADLAATLDVGLAGVLRIVEESPDLYLQSFQSNVNRASRVPTDEDGDRGEGLAPGMIGISTRVSVTFFLKN